jgi:hypothetical protein
MGGLPPPPPQHTHILYCTYMTCLTEDTCNTQVMEQKMVRSAYCPPPRCLISRSACRHLSSASFLTACYLPAAISTARYTVLLAIIFTAFTLVLPAAIITVFPPFPPATILTACFTVPPDAFLTVFPPHCLSSSLSFLVTVFPPHCLSSSLSFLVTVFPPFPPATIFTARCLPHCLIPNSTCRHLHCLGQFCLSPLWFLCKSSQFHALFIPMSVSLSVFLSVSVSIS